MFTSICSPKVKKNELSQTRRALRPPGGRRKISPSEHAELCPARADAGGLGEKGKLARDTKSLSRLGDLRRGTPEPRDPQLRRLMIERAQKLERLGLTLPVLPAVWELKPGAERTLRDLGVRGDIIKTMHRAMAGGPERAATDFIIEGTPAAPMLGRLVARGLLTQEPARCGDERGPPP